MNWYLDVFAEDENPSLAQHATQERLQQTELREGPCDDDCEMKSPFIGILPEESGKENGSPLHFQSNAEIDHQIQQAFKLGI